MSGFFGSDPSTCSASHTLCYVAQGIRVVEQKTRGRPFSVDSHTRRGRVPAIRVLTAGEQ
jgi:hypothetical protein